MTSSVTERDVSPAILSGFASVSRLADGCHKRSTPSLVERRLKRETTTSRTIWRALCGYLETESGSPLTGKIPVTPGVPPPLLVIQGMDDGGGRPRLRLT